ncbi:hypothetical protein [Siccibacter turicensis]|uniref:hypothetical protein n=1 Tax=Siccibacter turicensis TaxID=357233 RepID=UPI002A6B6776|nr:hypothetical protein [Siccibacter turicensis]MDY0971369.1 hypothetical protein [Siccibacter turicensis]
MVNKPYCKVDAFGFPAFTGWDTLRYKLLPNSLLFLTGDYYLWAYKAVYLKYNNKAIVNAAREENIPVLLLAGVAIAEAGGAPDRFKSAVVSPFRQLIIDTFRQDNSASNATSVGLIAMQLRVAAEIIGLDSATLTLSQQHQLATCLMSNEFNIRVVAKHLKELVIFDNPGIKDTVHLTDEQIIIAASRYNRGIQRSHADFIASLHVEKGNSSREYTSYGRRIIEKRNSIMKIMGASQ